MQLGKLQRNLSRITEEGAEILAISIDTPEAGRGLASALGLTFPLLSDPTMETIRAYRMKGEGMEMADMGYVVIDKKGSIRYWQLDRRFGEDVETIVRVLRQVKRQTS